jgi:hypothetical protein
VSPEFPPGISAAVTTIIVRHLALDRLDIVDFAAMAALPLEGMRRISSSAVPKDGILVLFCY